MSELPFCVPNPCTLIGSPPGCEEDWCFISRVPLAVGNLYSVSYVLARYAEIIFAGVPTMIQQDLTDLLLRIALIQSLPYILTFIILFITLMVTGVIMVEVGVILIMFTIVITIVCLTWIAFDAADVIRNVGTQIREQGEAGWDANVNEIIRATTRALIAPEEIACTPSCPTAGADLNEATLAALVEKYRKLGATCTNCVNPNTTTVIPDHSS